MSGNSSDVAPLLAEVAYFLIKKGEIERAQVVVQGLKELAPQGSSAHVLEGLCHFAKLDFGAAEKSYRSGLEREPESDLTKAFLAESLIPQRRYREAEDLLRKVITRKSDPAAVSLAQGLDEALKQGLFQRA